MEGICSKIYHISLEYVKRIREKHLAILKENNIPEEIEASELEPRLVYCYPVRLAVSAPPMPTVEMHMENSVVCIRYKGEMVKVSRSYFSKLVRAGEALADGLSGGLGFSLTRVLSSWPVMRSGH